MKGDTTKVESCGGLSSKAFRKFLKSFWDYYRKLLAYQNAQSDEAELRSEFWDIYPKWLWGVRWTKTINSSKNGGVAVSLGASWTSVALPTELELGTIVLRRNISYGTQTKDGTQAWDTFMSLRLVSWELVFFEYVRDRITRTENIESLAQIIRNKTALICLVGRGRQNYLPWLLSRY